jgi:hypothetical protein
MKKQVLALLAGVMMVCGATTAQAYTVETVAELTGSTTAGRFYVPVMNDVAILAGAGASFYTQDTKPTLEGQLGVRVNLPVLTTVDIYGVLKSADPTADGPGASKLKWIVVRKTWLSKLTNNLSLGLSIPLLKINTNGSNEIAILSGISPQVGMNLEF